MVSTAYAVIAPGGKRRTQYLREVIKKALEDIPKYHVPESTVSKLESALSVENESPQSAQALTESISQAAYELRLANTAAMVACDLEDALVWDTDPAKCGHPFRNSLTDGGTVCRHCEADLSDQEEMGS